MSSGWIIGCDLQVLMVSMMPVILEIAGGLNSDERIMYITAVTDASIHLTKLSYLSITGHG